MNQFTMEELVDLSEKFLIGEDDSTDGGLFQKLQQDQLDADNKKRPNLNNLFLEIDSHRNHDSIIYSECSTGRKRKPCANTNRSIRIVENPNANVHRKSTYASKIRRQNRDRIHQVIGGFPGLESNGLVHL